MLSFPAAVKVYLCTVACDMRRSFDGLSMMAEHVIRCNPFSGHLLVILSIVETCRRLKLPVRDYLAAVLPGLADCPIQRLPDLTPAA